MRILELSLEIGAAVIIFVLYILLLISLIIERKVFSRFDYDKRLKYLSASDFSLSDELVELDDQSLACHIYGGEQLEKLKKVVIFCHGIGAGHRAYMTEIASLVRSGFVVIAPDNYSCGESKGKRSNGFGEGIYAAKQCYDYLQNNAKFDGAKIYLVGHSWGGYSALCAAKDIEVDGVVSFGAFDSPVKTLVALLGAYGLNRTFAKILTPFLWLTNALIGGREGNMLASKCINESGTRALLIHGKEDRSVSLDLAAANKELGDNAEVLILEGKGHNAYNTIAAEAKLAELGALLRDKKATKEIFASFDFLAATEEDGEVMGRVITFLLSDAEAAGSEESRADVVKESEAIV